MAFRTLKNLLVTTTNDFNGAVELSARARVWQSQLSHFAPARFNNDHFTEIVGLAFMKSFLTWESFLEESFILYLLGKSSPSGYAPVRYAFPTSRQHALDLFVSDSRYADWTAASKVVNRAKRFFKDGRPFAHVIRPQSNLLDNLKTIRNALSHESVESTLKFESLVRNELTYFPVGMNPGLFLATLKPNLSMPKTYLEFYTENFRSMTEAIVPI